MDRFLHELWIARWALAKGFLLTIEVAGAAIVLGSILGFAVGVALAYGPKLIRWPCRLYVDLVRGTPVLVLVLASFYILAVVGIQFSAVEAGIFADNAFGYYWDYDNNGLRLAQLRFYPIPD